MDVRARLSAALVLLAVALATWAAPAAAQTAGSSGAAGPATTTAPRDPNALRRIWDLETPPRMYRRTGAEIERAAARVPKVAEARRKHPSNYAVVYTKGPGRWQVSFWSRGRNAKEIAQVHLDDATGAVLEAWTGHHVAWTMARGYPGAFGRKVTSPVVWIGLTLLFVAPFLTPRRPWRVLHLDLAVLAAFGVSLAYFNDARIDTSVPLVYPLLAYLLARMLWIALRRGREDEEARRPLPLLVPVGWLAVAIVFLVGFRVGLNVTNSNVIDVGYAGVIGADRLADGQPLYGRFPDDNEHGDTYGPVAYAAYVPFEQALPWNGGWDDLAAAHGAAIAFDLGCILLLYLIGRRLRGPALGVILAYWWAAYPFTLYVSNTNANDGLVALLVLAAVAFAARPAARGAFAALAGLSKFGPLALAPLLALHDRRSRGWRATALFAAGFAAVAGLAFLPVALEGESLRTVYDRTLGFQASRGSPFSIWGLYGLDALQTAWQVVAVLIALALAVVPRRRDVAGLAAACAAILIALQAGATHWFYLYIAWFFGLVGIALLGRYRPPSLSPPSGG